MCTTCLGDAHDRTMKLALLLLLTAGMATAATTVPCPCKNPSWCHPLTAETAAAPSRRPCPASSRAYATRSGRSPASCEMRASRCRRCRWCWRACRRRSPLSFSRLPPAEVSKKKGKLKVGYRSIKAITKGLISNKGETLNGHEFHGTNLRVERSERRDSNSGGGRRNGNSSGGNHSVCGENSGACIICFVPYSRYILLLIFLKGAIHQQHNDSWDMISY